MRGNKGFTLIELVMVIVILGILAAVAVPKYIDMKTSADAAAVEAYIGSLRSALSNHIANHYLNDPSGAWVASGDALVTGYLQDSSLPDALTHPTADTWTDGTTTWTFTSGNPPTIVATTS